MRASCRSATPPSSGSAPIRRGSSRRPAGASRCQRPAARRAGCRHRRLRGELHHLALPPSRADHDHARHVPAARARSANSAQLADRRRRRPAGREDVADLRLFPLRSLRQGRLRLFARRAVPRVPGGAAHDQFAVRPLAARHPRELRAHAGDRRAEPRASAQDLHHLGRDGRHRRRAAGADHRDGLARSRSASSARPTCW